MSIAYFQASDSGVVTMVWFLAFLVASSVFMVAAVLVADVLLSRWAARQDIVWRVTLVAIYILPCVLMLRPWLSTGALAIPVALNADNYEFSESHAAIVVPPNGSTLPTTAAHTRHESGSIILAPVTSPAESRTSADSSLKHTESPYDIVDLQVFNNVSDLPRSENWLNRISNAASWIAVLSVAGSLYHLIVIFGGFWQLFRQSRAAVADPDGRWQRIADELSACDSSASVQVRFCSNASTPSIGGFLRGIILIPESMRSIYDDQIIRQILIHERTHLLRGDQWFNFFLLHTVGTVLWIHPLYYWMKRRIIWLREVICDASVMQEFSAVQYAETLLVLSKRNTSLQQNVMAVAMAEPRSLLGKRVTFLLSLSTAAPLLREPAVTRRISWLTSGIVCTMIGLVRFTAAQESAQPETANVARNVAPDESVPGNQAPEKTIGAADKAQPIELAQSNQRDDGLLGLNLMVRMPDGAPAARATVKLHPWVGQSQKAHTDEHGRVTIRSVFGSGSMVHASSADGTYQATLRKEAPEMRTFTAQPIELTLATAIDHHVIVKSGDKPVADAQVVVRGANFAVTGITGSDGVAQLKLPADDQLTTVTAWHPELGIAGVSWLEQKPQQPTTTLSLHASAELTVRLVDAQENPVPNMDVCVTSLVLVEKNEFRKRELIWMDDFAASHVRTNEHGEVSIPWVPKDNISRLNADLTGSMWKVEQVDPVNETKRKVTVHLSRLIPVTGRLIMPEGVSARGLLVTGHGFGMTHAGDKPQVRARRDGTFVINVPSNYAYLLGVSDREWVSEPWTGVIRKTDDADAAALALNVRRGTTVTVRVTDVESGQPVADVYVDLRQNKSFQWTAASGEKKSAMADVGSWVKTDYDGMVRGAVNPGKVTVRAYSKSWRDEKMIQVNADQPIEVAFQQKQEPEIDRKVIARMTQDGTAYQPSKTWKVFAWTEPPLEIGNGVQVARVAPVHRPIIHDDNSIEVVFQEKSLTLLAIDRERNLCGYAKLEADGESMQIVMQPTASYTGTVLDQDGEPIANRNVQLLTERSFLEAAAPQRTDRDGKFHFDDAPSGVPLRVTLPREDDQPDYSLHEQIFLEPGEARNEGEFKAQIRGVESSQVAPPRPLSERLKSAIENARVSGMFALVILQGDDSKDVARLTGRVLGEQDDSDNSDDSDEANRAVRAIYHYLPITVEPPQVESEAVVLNEHKWPRPKVGELVMVVVDGQQQTLSIETINLANLDLANQKAEEFLERYKRVFEDGRVQLLNGRKQAELDGRKVWVIIGGPRCGPCFQMARWIDRQHELLEKDYVIVKLMAGIQPHVDEISNEIGGSEHGIPWYVITEPGGNILTTSSGPLGNIGMPSVIEDFRHFRKMLEKTAKRLSAAEIDELIQSLSARR